MIGREDDVCHGDAVLRTGVLVVVSRFCYKDEGSARSKRTCVL